MDTRLAGRDFLTLLDYTPEEISYLIDLASTLKYFKHNRVSHRYFEDKNIALIFEKTSTRTRSAFEVAAHDLGMGSTYIGPGASQLGKKESVEDTAKVLSRMYDAIMYRGFGQEIVQTLADASDVPVFAHTLNATAPANLARAAAAVGAKLVQVSTDYVLAGADPMPQAEDAPTNPNTAYGTTKLAGERAVLELNPKTFVTRTAWLYGTHGKNFVRTMVALGRTHDRITVVCDQHGSPTFAGDLAYEILALLTTENYGVYHCTNNGATTWDVFARRIMANAGLACEVAPVTTAEYSAANPAAAPRPLWSILDNKHLRDTIGDSMRSWDVAIDQFMQEVEL